MQKWIILNLNGSLYWFLNFEDDLSTLPLSMRLKGQCHEIFCLWFFS